MKRKIGTLDIETYPGTYRAFADNMYETRLMKEVEPIRLASFAYKELGKKKITVMGEWEFKKEIDFVRELWQIFDENDVLIGQNIKKFDNKQSNTFFAQYGLPKHSPVQWIDTMLVARENFKLPSYSLKYLLVFFSIGTKLETGGESLWFGCEEGNEADRKKMLRYNANDTIQTELLAVYFKELGYIKKWPFSECYVIGEGCVRCGNDDMQRRGREVPRAGGFVSAFMCKRCGKRNYTDVVLPYAATL